MQKNLIIFSIFLGLAFVGNAQKVSVYSINEQRSTGDGSFGNRCDIELKISGDEVRKYKFVKVSKITKATDDMGLDLLMEEDDYDFKYEGIEETGKIQFETKTPSRKATVIQELAGELMLYGPTEANGGILKIPNYQAKANSNLLPADAGIKLVYLDKTSIEKYTQEQTQKQQDEIKKLPAGAREIAELLVNALQGFSGFGDEDNQAMFVMDGDETKLVEIYFEDTAGKKIERNGYTKSGNLIAYYFNEPPKANWKLVLNIETPGSIKKVPFTLMNIDLP